MAFGSFDRLALRDFVASERAPEALWVFVHIPKTAGSSFGSELRRVRRPYRNIHVDYKDRDLSHKTKMDRAVDQFIQDAREKRFMSCSGHFDMATATRIKEAQPDARFISFLRNPVERVVSDYRYARTPTHPPFQDFIREYPDIYAYIESPDSQNKMSRILSPERNMSPDRLVRYIDETYSFVGLVEMYPMSFNIISQLFGLDLRPTEYIRKTESTSDNVVVRDNGLLQWIKKVNETDLVLYEHVRAKLAAKRKEWAQQRGNSASVDQA